MASTQQGVLVAYKGETMITAASSGNLPLCVLLWGMGSAKQINLMTAVDESGNNPFHHAVRSQTTDVMAFFNQQTKGMLTPEKRLVDATNNAGETALLRAVATGCMPVIKALLDEKSDVCHVNTHGQNVLHLCAKESQLWTLNYLYNHIRTESGTDKATEMLQAVDKSNNGLLEYAAEAGDINLAEYLMRQRLNPYRAHPDSGMTPLHVAVSRHRLELARFLLQCGANPHAPDAKGKSSLQHHALQQDPVLKAGLLKHPKVSKCGLSCLSTKNDTFPAFDVEKGVSQVSEAGRSFAIECPIRSNFLHMILYAAVVCGLLLLPLVVPFWAYFPLVAVVAFGYKTLSGQVASLKKRARNARGRIILTPLQAVLGAEEKFPGLWLGSLSACLFFCFACMAYDDSGNNGLDILGVDSIAEEPGLFYTSTLFVLVTITTWALMVIFPPTPGLVDTRQADFGTIMDLSLELGGVAPDSSLFCRTSMVRKPVRSKYCSTSGFVVARFDHYCVWLNSAIGYGNHRIFMIFLYTHVIANVCFLGMLIKALIRVNDKTGPAFVVGQLLSQKYFFVTVLLVYVMVVTAGLTFLMVEQTTNIVRNVTTNERINQSRYAWMKGPDGRPFNRFNKGVIANVLDFLLIPGFATDYRTIMDIPEAVKTQKHANNVAPPKKKDATATTTTTVTSPPTLNALHANSQAESHTHGPNCNHGHDSDSHL